MAILNPSAMLIVLGGTLGADDHRHELRRRQEHPEALHEGVQLRARPTSTRRSPSSSATPRPPAATACWPSTRSPSTIEDPFTKKGLQLVVDGTDPDLVADILEAENDAMRKRHAAAVQPFEKAGGYAPTMGIIGTVFGLVHVLGNLDKPETLGPSISAAFIATLLGVASANVIYLPIAARLKQLSGEELHARALIVEGILSIQAGDNPRVVQEKLITFVPPAQRPPRATQAARRGRREGGRVVRHVGIAATQAGATHHEEEHENEERWLVSFADMMTLLFCLFMVLFAISSVNTSKFEALQKSLQDAFSGAVLSGGKSIMRLGLRRRGDQAGLGRAAAALAAPARRALNNTSSQDAAEEAKKAAQEQQDFKALKRRIDNALPRAPGLKGKVQVTIRRRGLVIQLLTDKVFFDSGEATLKPAARHLVDKIAGDRARRAHAPGRRRGPHRLAADLTARSTRPTGSSPAPAPAAVVRDFAAERRARAPACHCAGYGSQEPDRHQLDARRAREEPPGRDRPLPHPHHRHGVITPRTEAHNTMVKKIVPVIVLLARPRRRLQVRPGQAGQGRGSPSPRSTAPSTCSRRSSWSTSPTAASRSCRSASSSPTTTPPRSPPAAEGAATPPEGYGAMTQEGVVRDVITDDLTDAKDNELIDAQGPRAAQGGDPQGPQEAHRCKGRGRPVLRRHRPVRRPNGRDRRLRTLRDHHGRPVEPAALRIRSRPRSSRACTTCRWSWRSRSAARR